MKDSVSQLVGEFCWVSTLHAVQPNEVTEVDFERPGILKTANTAMGAVVFF